MPTTNDRWQIACHEAGHGVAAIIHGGRCEGLVIFADGGGLAANSELLSNQDAYATAAGPAAEVLASRFPAPEAFSTTTPTVDDIESLPIFQTAPSLACEMVRTPDKRRNYPNDDQRIAWWAIGGNEDTPETWLPRVEMVKRVAAGIVDRHADAIVRVAAELYRRGSLGRDEILLLMGANE